MDVLRFHNYHAPDHVRVFSIPVRGIKRRDDEVLVYDVRVGANRVLRHYSFTNRWFEVNCSLDLEGRFVTESGPIDWAFNCDISTPHFVVGADVFNMDLWLDVLVGPDGRQHAVIDAEDLVHATNQGWLTEMERAGAENGLSDLLNVIRTDGLVNFLDRVCPFRNVADCELQPPMVRRSVSEFPMLHPSQRHLYFAN